MLEGAAMFIFDRSALAPLVALAVAAGLVVLDALLNLQP